MEYAYDFWVPPSWALRSLAWLVSLGWAALMVRHSPWSSRGTAGAVASWVLLVVLGLCLPSSAIDPSWLSNLQEGTQVDVVRAARGENGHAGLMQAAAAEAWMGAGRSLPDMVPLHLGLTLAVGSAMALLAGAVAGVEVAVGVALAWVGALTVRFGVLGEGAGPMASWWTLVLLSSCVLWSRERWAAPVVVGAGVLLALTRTELALVAMVVTAASALQSHPLPSKLAERPVVERLAWGAAAVVLVHALVRTSGIGGLRGAWVSAASHPLEPSPLFLPSLLLATWPVVVAALALVGLAWSLVHPVRSHGVGWALLALHKLYVVAGHGGVLTAVSATELLRYHTHVPVLVVVLALHGWRVLAVKKTWVVGLAAFGCVLPPMPSVMARTPNVHWGAGWTATGVYGDTQQDGRALVHALNRWSHCGFLVRDTPARPGEDGVWLAWLAPDAARAVPGKGAHITLAELSSSLTPAEAAATLEASCVMVYEGLGCRVMGGERCGEPFGEVLWEQALDAPAYTHPNHELPPSPGMLRVWQVR